MQLLTICQYIILYINHFFLLQRAMKDKKPPASPKPPKGSKATAEAIVALLHTRHGRASKADIARHFGITGNDRIGLKHLLKEMLVKGALHQGSFRSFALPGAHKITKTEKKTDKRERKYGERPAHEENRAAQFVGLYEPMKTGGGLINPVARGEKNTVMVAEDKTGGAKRGDFVQAVYGPQGWAVTEILARDGEAGMVSLMAIKTMDIPNEFPEAVLNETKNISVPPLGKRTDLRDLPLITIDGEDARDFDDAVWAAPDDAPDNKDGWLIIVAIADVSHYVRPHSELDDEAYKRGNSVYFPDRVVPMLPEALSNDLCSLRPHEPRACMAAKMRINRDGILIDIKILRGLMQSAARLTYNMVQEALDGHPNDLTKPLMKTAIEPLYQAYKVLEKARQLRGAVDLDLPERKVILKDGVVHDISKRARLDSHKLIEELMILANVAVATALEQKDQELLYRIHAKPDNARWASVRDFLLELGLRPKYGLSPSPKDMQALLKSVVGHDEAPLVNDVVLRSMSQAAYSPENVGHFGLALERYAHFTSPIRRYADLVVHRALIRAFKLGDDGLGDHDVNRLEQTGEHISERERVAQSAERETIDRYIALFLSDQVGATFAARISGVTHFGVFVNVEPMGADGLIPIRTLPNDFYIHDEKRHSLVGRRTGLTFRLAMPLTVRLVSVDSATGRLQMELMPGTITMPEGHTERRAPRRSEDGRRDRSNPRDRPDRPGGPRGSRSGPKPGGKGRKR
jgi:ribonuclease R